MRAIDADKLYFAQRYARIDPDSDRLTPVLAVDKYQIENAPTLDVELVVHGRWEYHGGDDDMELYGFCTNCHYGEMTEDDIERLKPKRCPNCGARMDGDV